MRGHDDVRSQRAEEDFVTGLAQPGGFSRPAICEQLDGRGEETAVRLAMRTEPRLQDPEKVLGSVQSRGVLGKSIRVVSAALFLAGFPHAFDRRQIRRRTQIN